jgi:cell division protein DivIC
LALFKEIILTKIDFKHTIKSRLLSLNRGKETPAVNRSSNRKKRRKKTPAFLKTKNENRIGMFVAFLAIMTLTVVVGVNSISLRQKNAVYQAREDELKAQIADEDARALELDELSTYVKTKKYAEEVAKDKLGLVYENEIIFQESD